MHVTATAILAGRNPNKTLPTPADPPELIATASNQRLRADAEVPLRMMEEASGQHACMWGPWAIGFGSYHYGYQCGRGADAMASGFTPRSSSLAS